MTQVWQDSKGCGTGCFMTTIGVLLICYLCGTLPLMTQWLLWNVDSHDDYQIRVKHYGAGMNDDFRLTVCDGEVVQAECLRFPFRDTDGSPLCPFEETNAPEWMYSGYSLVDVQKYTVDRLYRQALWDHWIPICDVELNSDDHYPENIGCGFIEGEWIEVSEFTSVDCSDIASE